MTDLTLLTRTSVAVPTPPERIVHLGLGAFHRAHQAWYTAHASDADQWGIVAFTGRSRDLVDRLAQQDGLYTIVERGADGDRFEVVPSIVRVEAGDDVPAFVTAVAAPQTAILTLTITEAGYRLAADGTVDLADPVVASDVAMLRSALVREASLAPARAAEPSSALGRVLLGLDARRRAGAGPIALVPCDNLPNNGGLLRRALADLAGRVSDELAAWLSANAAVVSTSVDRITPAIDAVIESAAIGRATGCLDAAPVVTEPFSDWVLSGEFPAGRPEWEAAGARFVDHLEPWEHRKLWMLNGAHTVLATLGQARGHAVVSTAIEDPVCRAAVESLWDDDAAQLPDLDLTAYRAALLTRFRNPRIEHRLTQIALDSTTKVRLRIVPVALRELAAGRAAGGCAAAIAAWILGVRSGTAALPGGIAAVAASEPLEAAARDALLTALDSGFTDHPGFADLVGSALARLSPDKSLVPLH
ncbi:mannitol dehydrogenase family protein [Agromyces endophyticus]|uniref:mannitol dehydrogenase family protein n=1 Tax=Agromyces sp. H17E-10 TaxID=2932244 RepID=UPI001FD24D82|nr:mannitol dehydrogenase family protein [Agromyces sp. H17E-10]UOQ89168.1 mannitol dehydrogenase family protein [Agromyces sp. H17E-10]